MILNGLKKIFGAVGDVVKAPFKALSGAATAALGVVTLPLRLVGGLFGGGSSPAAVQGAQMGVTPYLP